MADLSEMAAVEVVDCLVDFRFAVHHERAVADDRFAERLAVKQQQRRVFADVEFQAAAVAFHDRQLGGAHVVAVVETDGAAQHEERRGVAFRQVECDTMADFQPQIPDVHRREAAGRADGIAMAAGDDARRAGIAGQRDHGNPIGGDALVAGRRHLVPGRQVHPQLHHLEAAAFLGERRAVEFLVDQAGSGGHPLHVAGADGAAAARRITVRDAAVIDDGHRLEAAVRMLADAELARGRREVGRAGVVHQQEGRHFLGDVAVGKNALDREAVADPVAAVAALDECQFFHDRSPLVVGHTLEGRQFMH